MTGRKDDPDRKLLRDIAAEIVGLTLPGAGFARAAWTRVVEEQRADLRSALRETREDVVKERAQNAALVRVVEAQADAIDRLTAENDRLIVENEKLRRR